MFNFRSEFLKNTYYAVQNKSTENISIVLFDNVVSDSIYLVVGQTINLTVHEFIYDCFIRVTKTMTDTISEFVGEYEYMRNDFESTAQVVFEGEVYSCVQRAFQAAKTQDVTTRARIRDAKNIREANKIGRYEVDLPDDWDDRRVDVMTTLVKEKFRGSSELAKKLVSTGDCDIEMGNSRDDFWGVLKDGSGDNMMGKILMKVRDEFKVLLKFSTNV